MLRVVLALSVWPARYAWQWCGAKHADARTLGELFWADGYGKDRGEQQLHVEESGQRAEAMRVTHLLPCFVPAILLVPQDGGVRREGPGVQIVRASAQGGPGRPRCLGGVARGQDGMWRGDGEPCGACGASSRPNHPYYQVQLGPLCGPCSKGIQIRTPPSAPRPVAAQGMAARSPQPASQPAPAAQGMAARSPPPASQPSPAALVFCKCTGGHQVSDVIDEVPDRRAICQLCGSLVKNSSGRAGHPCRCDAGTRGSSYGYCGTCAGVLRVSDARRVVAQQKLMARQALQSLNMGDADPTAVEAPEQVPLENADSGGIPWDFLSNAEREASQQQVAQTPVVVEQAGAVPVAGEEEAEEEVIQVAGVGG